MEFEEAKVYLRDQYLAAGFVLEQEEPTEFIISRQGGRQLFRVAQDDIEDYAKFQELRDTFSVRPGNCNICNPSYREQVVYALNPQQARLFHPIRGTGYVFGEIGDEQIYAMLSPATNLLANYFRFDPDYLSLCMRRTSFSFYTTDPVVDIRESFYRPSTISVHNIPEATTDRAFEMSSRIIDACLFELSYLKRIPFGLESEWPQLRRRLSRDFSTSEPFRGNQLPLRSVQFNSDIVRFYQLGVSSEVPNHQFLAFYQVLEYFFVTVADEQLYQKIARRVNDPQFNTTRRQLDRLIDDVLKHRSTTDETRMLESVLEKYVDKDELVEFITRYEIYLGEKLYSKRRILFGTEVLVHLDANQVIGSVARVVRETRNALVHSSDRYGRLERYIPFSETTEIVKKEVPLVKFLAEKVIIASATPWSNNAT